MSGTSSPRTPKLDAKRVRDIGKGLDNVFDAPSTPVVRFDPSRERIAVFSDLHKGRGDDADDFRRCEHAFTMALGWYLENGYRLFMLGDCEELWEENPEDILKRYPEVFRLEGEFRKRGGLERFWGNHDDLWGSRRNVRKHLQPDTVLGADLQVHEGLRLEVGDSTLFFVHGHQGTTSSDKLGPVARWVVRHIWRRVQRATGWSATTPARDYVLRAGHDLAMTLWAAKRGVLLVAGHTHRPVFAQSTPDPPPTRAEEALRGALADAGGEPGQAGSVRGELEYSRTANRRPAKAVTVSPPCYFNTGCCSFPDGDITGLEIADGEIRLVRWPAVFSEICERGVPGIKAEKRFLEGARRPLADVLREIADAAGTEPTLLEHDVRPG